MMTASPSKHYSGHCKAKAADEENTQEHLEKGSAERNVDDRLQ